MNLVVGLEHALWRPGGHLHRDLPDQSALRLLDAFTQTNARLVVTTSMSPLTLDLFRVNVRGVAWCAEQGRWVHAGTWQAGGPDPSDWISAQFGPGPTVAIGGGIPCRRFADLAPYELAVVPETNPQHGVRTKLSGPSAVRAFLWWLIQERDAVHRSDRPGIVAATNRA